jgi:heme/copper-type cytochrome/quinol oxidase subunit 2
MHFAVLAACALAALVVFAIMLHSIATFRRVRGVGPAAFIRSALVETLWAIVPVAILFGSAAPAVRMVMQERKAQAPAFAMRAEEPAVAGKSSPSLIEGQAATIARQ